MVYKIAYRDLDEWVKTKAKIGDIAYYWDLQIERYYMYIYANPNDNPYWRQVVPTHYMIKEFKNDLQ